MIRRPPRSTRTDTLFPYTTLFRSKVGLWDVIRSAERRTSSDSLIREAEAHDLAALVAELPDLRMIDFNGGKAAVIGRRQLPRSEERRVGKECVSTCRSRWSPYH